MSDYIALQKLIAPPPRREVDVEVPALGGKVRIRNCSPTQRTQAQRLMAGPQADEVRQRLVVMAVVKPEGLTLKHVKDIAEHDSDALEPLIEAITNLWAVDKHNELVEAVEKNSGATAS